MKGLRMLLHHLASGGALVRGSSCLSVKAARSGDICSPSPRALRKLSLSDQRCRKKCSRVISSSANACAVANCMLQSLLQHVASAAASSLRLVDFMVFTTRCFTSESEKQLGIMRIRSMRGRCFAKCSWFGAATSTPHSHSGSDASTTQSPYI